MSKKKTAPNDEIWLRQPGESERAYAAFKVYLELGDARTITATSQKVGKNRAFIDGLRSKYDWKNRARAYDNFVMFSIALKRRREYEKQFERFGKMGDRLLSLGASLLKRADHSKLNHKEAIAYMRLALKFAEASRDMFALKEFENIHSDVKLLRIETTHANKSSISGASNFEEAIGGTVNDVWTDEGEVEDTSNI